MTDEEKKLLEKLTKTEEIIKKIIEKHNLEYEEIVPKEEAKEESENKKR